MIPHLARHANPLRRETDGRPIVVASVTLR